MRASTADVGDLGVSVSLEDVWKIRPETPLADVRRIGIETSVVVAPIRQISLRAPTHDDRCLDADLTDICERCLWPYLPNIFETYTYYEIPNICGGCPHSKVSNTCERCHGA